MRLSLPIRHLIVIVLVAVMPWCLCRWAPSACGAERTASASASKDDDCCTHRCCDSTDAKDSGGRAPAGKDCGNCPSSCCAPKVHVAQSLPTVPCDTVGLLLPPTLLVDATAGAWLSLPVAAVHDDRPPGRPPDGRSVLLQSSILRS